MKNFKTTLASCLSLAAVAAFSCFDAQGATASANATATALPAISIANGTVLQFSRLVPSAVIGTATISSVTKLQVVAGGITATTGGPTMSAASFTVTGGATKTYAITLPSSASLTGAGVPMLLNAFESTPSLTGVVDGTTLYVGATLNVGVSQVVGAYTTTFPVTVSYN
jgi:hypothetical protein